ncbi:MAG: hypothetical protein I8H71_12975 [Xanthomonadaceae bacterium]|nr:hypothetical protein [Xanthomonadaceae bacterium]
MHWFPWQVLAFLTLLAFAGAWAWLPDRVHAVLQARRAGRALPLTFVVMMATLYASMASSIL